MMYGNHAGVYIILGCLPRFILQSTKGVTIKCVGLHLDMRYLSWPDISGACWEIPGGGWFSPPGSDVGTDQARVGSESDQQTGRHNSRNWLLAFSVGPLLSGATPNNIRLLNQFHLLWMQCSLQAGLLTLFKWFHI